MKNILHRSQPKSTTADLLARLAEIEAATIEAKSRYYAALRAFDDEVARVAILTREAQNAADVKTTLGELRQDIETSRGAYNRLLSDSYDVSHALGS